MHTTVRPSRRSRRVTTAVVVTLLVAASAVLAPGSPAASEDSSASPQAANQPPPADVAVIDAAPVAEHGASGEVAGNARTSRAFPDVPPGSLFFDDITWLTDEEITTGFSDGSFGPVLPISRQSMAAFLFRYANPGASDPTCAPEDAVFPDVASNHPFCGVIAWLADSGITTGFPDGTFRPLEPISRQSMAAFLFRYGHPGDPDPTCVPEDATFPDVPADSLFCGVIAWLAETGITAGFPDGMFRPTEPISRQGMSAFLRRHAKAAVTVEWGVASVEVGVREGTKEAMVLPVGLAGTPLDLEVEVGGALVPVVSSTMDDLVPEGDDFALPVMVELPMGADPDYDGDLQITNRGAEVGEALPFSVTTELVDALTVPPDAAEPTAARIFETPEGIQLVGDEIVVGLSFDVPDPDATIIEIAGLTGAEIIGAIPDSFTYQLVFPGATQEQIAIHQTTILSYFGVEFAVRNYVSEEPLAVTPDDPELGTWDTAAPAGNNWGLEWIDAPTAWDTTTGGDIGVGIIDADFDPGHGDLSGNVDHQEGTGASAGGHATHVSGTACGVGNNAKGIAGVAWSCSLRMYPYGVDSATTQQAMVKAATNGARIVNMSLQFVENNQCGTAGTAASLTAVADTNRVLGRAILHAQRADNDVLWVFAAGNECRDAKYASPASLVHDFPTNVITVASIDSAGALSPFSNFGDLVTVAAPGSDIHSTLPRTCVLWIFCTDAYGKKSGTSMATPHVTGLAALVLSDNPGLSASQVKACIVNGAIDAGFQPPGHDFYIIDAPSALACEGEIPLPPQVDMVLLFDTTGSMGGVLSLAKSEAAAAIEAIRLAAPGTAFQFSVAYFEDYEGVFDSTPCGSTYNTEYGFSGDVPFELLQGLSANTGTVTAAIDSLQLGNGSDGPESYGRALWEVAQADTGAAIGFRPDALKLVVMFGDNVPHDLNINENVEAPPLIADTGIDPGRNGTVDCGGDDIDFQDDALAGLIAQDIHLLTVDSGYGYTEDYWRLWSSMTGGGYTSLTGGETLGDIILELLALIPDP